MVLVSRSIIRMVCMSMRYDRRASTVRDSGKLPLRPSLTVPCVSTRVCVCVRAYFTLAFDASCGIE